MSRNPQNPNSRSVIQKALSFLPLYLRSRSAARYARRKGLPGLQFDPFGRYVGGRLLLSGNRGASYLITPVNNIRYYEFDFTLGYLPKRDGRFLDISSPRLFSLYVASRRPKATITMLNPDVDDAAQSRSACQVLRLNNVAIETAGVDAVGARKGEFDCVWSISVIEHISGAYEDREAVRFMFDALRPGGRLILTIPVDRQFHDEYRDVDYYGTQPGKKGQFFFSRHYDRSAIQERLIDQIGVPPKICRWYGEKVPGRWMEYEQRWIREGLACTVDDEREMVDQFQEYPSWEAMPGWGFAGLMFEKP
jgi:SAM-dependent methyltransferase